MLSALHCNTTQVSITQLNNNLRLELDFRFRLYRKNYRHFVDWSSVGCCSDAVLSIPRSTLDNFFCMAFSGSDKKNCRIGCLQRTSVRCLIIFTEVEREEKRKTGKQIKFVKRKTLLVKKFKNRKKLIRKFENVGSG